ncbi:hypothetical protein [Chryseobacterium echinoideorum]|uniref:hypothetical protein n=1 Tax=Chryseobacterium echinoideorum TaxID=1549648 RepID=UPI001184C7DC|nr:hypothetical protein [Chryseobacterium echinoideorum]
MPFLNFESRHFSEAEKAAISTALQDLQTALSGKVATLTVVSINEQNKQIVNKMKDYRDSDPQLSSPEVDWEEFGKDCDIRRGFCNHLQIL